MPRPSNKSTLLALFLGASVGVFAACYQAPIATGWYRCENNDGCGSGMICDDGVCCNAEGTPMCPTLVRSNGRCPDGGEPFAMYPDLDHDGFGTNAPGDAKQFCGIPALGGFSLDAGDCLDTPGLGETSYPGAPELCDALDNDCDGEPDDGLDGGSAYYEDADNDGYGDPNSSRIFCAPPQSGWVTSSNDCDPVRNNVNPGATEVCDGLDNDCAGGVDNNPTGLASSCVVPGQLGICAQGKEVCTGGNPVCTQTKVAKEETCNGTDEDCDGTVDNQPGCGGPVNLLATGVATKGALRNTTVNNPGFTVCQKGSTGWNGTGASFSGSTWSGDGAYMHMVYFEHPNGGSWDLTPPGTKLKLKVDVSMVRQNATNAWNLFAQPVFLFCSKGNPGACTRIRYVNTSAAWQPSNSTSALISIPVDGSDPNWPKTQTGQLDDVNRIEIYVMPRDNGTSVPHFDINFLTLGFTTQ